MLQTPTRGLLAALFLTHAMMSDPVMAAQLPAIQEVQDTDPYENLLNACDELWMARRANSQFGVQQATKDVLSLGSELFFNEHGEKAVLSTNPDQYCP